MTAKSISLADSFIALKLHAAVVTETWFKGTQDTKEVLEDLAGSFNIETIRRDRKGKRGGGVAILFNKNLISLKEHRIKTSGYEIVSARGKMPKNTREFFIFAVYLPPSQKVSDTEKALECISSAITDIKITHNNPYIIIAGDINNKQFDLAYRDHHDMAELQTPPTRKDRRLDLIATNFNEEFKEAKALPPLEDEQGSCSDHLLLYTSASLSHAHQFTIKKFKTRSYKKGSKEAFEADLRSVDWGPLLGPNLAKDFHTKICNMVDQHFPYKTITFKSTEDPWINDYIRKAIGRRKAIYKAEGRSEKWKEQKTRADDLIATAKEGYYRKELDKIKQNGPCKIAYKALRNISAPDRPKEWSIEDLRPGIPTEQIVEELADFFSAISQEFKPLEEEDIPTTYDREIIPLTTQQVEARLKEVKIPTSMVPGDIPSDLVKPLAGVLAEPLTHIFNQMPETGKWPHHWLQEYTSALPKTSFPTDMSELRNISCTPLFSKVLESFVLDSIGNELGLGQHQFGGIKGSGVDHFLIHTWERIHRALEDGKSAVTLIAIDFQKAFNRLSHPHCLLQLARRGASNQTLRMVSAFLRGRKMMMKSGTVLSSPRQMPGGAPQGTKLGNFLFCATTDCFSRLPQLC